MKKFTILISVLFVFSFFSSSLFCQAEASSGGSTKAAIVTDEAEAVIKIMSKNALGQKLDEADWQRLFSTEGYVRLKKREHSMGRKFEDSTFRAFVLSPVLMEKYSSLKSALEGWKKMNVDEAARQALTYLPENTLIKAKIYPVIKPAVNSFVFETDTDPAIFMYINPSVKPEKLFNTLSHELHHIGIAMACGNSERDTTLKGGLMDALDWMTAFSEGRAVLAAAGGPEIHPHAVSDSLERSTWDRNLANAERDMKELEEFFLKLIDGRIPEDEKTKEGMKFIQREDAPQGAFYTVGWLMASTVEKVLGRERLVASSCDDILFLSDYNLAAKELNHKGGNLPLWSEKLLSQLKMKN
ncbi:MAG TPA: DUF5700 domain-containing putative Zn-dependent protease [Ignavibacteriales bacterium]|nr:DUF5700 domain-containing putative Zn-dependent protease [Ignavibacteriales bacterium]